MRKPILRWLLNAIPYLLWCALAWDVAIKNDPGSSVILALIVTALTLFGLGDRAYAEELRTRAEYWRDLACKDD